MKTKLLTIILFLIFTKCMAQQISLATEPVTKPNVSALNWENQKLRSDLTLTDAQYEKIKPITLERAEARSIVLEMFKYEPKKQEARLREIDSQFDGEFEAVLSEKQFKKYLKLQGRSEKITEAPVQQPAEPDFNKKVQAMIAKAVAPAIDSALIPKAGNSDSLAQDTTQTIVPSGFSMKKDTVLTDGVATQEQVNTGSENKKANAPEHLVIPEKLELPPMKKDTIASPLELMPEADTLKTAPPTNVPSEIEYRPQMLEQLPEINNEE